MTALAEEKKDTLFLGRPARRGSFVFDDRVTAVFEDMLNRSIPGHAAMIRATGLLAAAGHRPGTACFDLGCSLGHSAAAMAAALKGRAATITAIDSSPHMIAACRELAARGALPRSVRLVHGDIRKVRPRNASVVAMNYVLQFVEPEKKTETMRLVYEGMVPGGILVLSEKIRFQDPVEESRQSRLYRDFKLANGYAPEEISAKDKALKGVMFTETAETHFRRLGRLGFRGAAILFRYANFISIAAVK